MCANDVIRPVRQYHQEIVEVIYRFPQDTPPQLQAFVEDHCLARLRPDAQPARQAPRY